jgi:hypothetical protein
MRGMALHYAIGLQLAKLIGENFFGDLAELFMQRGEAQLAERKIPQDLHFPFA